MSTEPSTPPVKTTATAPSTGSPAPVAHERATSSVAAPLPCDRAVLVIGAGTMGRGIAAVAALQGHPVWLFDANPPAVSAAVETIAAEWNALVEKGRLSVSERDAALSRLQRCDDYRAVAAHVGLVIEAIVEDLAVKQALFRELEALVPTEAILASNTSSLSITAIASACARPERVVGMHFFNPATRMKLVEVVSGLATAPEVAARIAATATAWGKIAVVAKSTPGFIVNRVARPYYGEALRLIQEGATDPATLDALMRDAGGYPMGPCELMDLIGHDVNFAVTRSVWEALGFDPRYQPNLIQQELVHAGRLGRKSGIGFYDYRPGATRPAPQEASVPEPYRGTLTCIGEEPWLEALVARWQTKGMAVRRVTAPTPARVELDNGVCLMFTDGRPAFERAASERTPALALLDWVRDPANATRIAVAFSPATSETQRQDAIAALAAAGFAVTVVADRPGLIVARINAMLANEAADAVAFGVASACDIDLAMRFGVNYPEGPLAWCERVGAKRVVALLGNLQHHYGEARYRVSSELRRRAAAQGGKSA